MNSKFLKKRNFNNKREKVGGGRGFTLLSKKKGGTCVGKAGNFLHGGLPRLESEKRRWCGQFARASSRGKR